jgi:hypothetical protein
MSNISGGISTGGLPGANAHHKMEATGNDAHQNALDN